MTDDLELLDDALAGLPRLSPGRGSADRVMHQVRLLMPLWLVPARDWLRGVTSGVRGWLLLVTFALATLVSWGLVGVAAFDQRATIAPFVRMGVADAAAGVAAGASGVREVVRDRLLELSLPFSIVAIKLFLILYLAVALVCAIGLWWLMRTPRAAEVHHA